MDDERTEATLIRIEPQREAAVLAALERLTWAWSREPAAGFALLGRELAALLPCDRAYLVRLTAGTGEPRIGEVYSPADRGLRPGQLLPEHSPTLDLLEGHLDVMVCSDTSCWSTGFERALAAEGLRSALGVVLRGEGEALGLLVVASTRALAYGPAEVRLLRRMAPALGELLGRPLAPPEPAPETSADPEEAQRALAGSMARYFNGLLGYLLGGVETLREAGGLSPEGLGLLAQLEEQMGQGAGVVRALGHFAAETPPEELEAFDLADLVAEVLAAIRPVWQAAAEGAGPRLIAWHEYRPGQLVRANRRELREALLGVVLNAAQALPGGGVIHLTEGAEGLWRFIEVRDPGEGMTPEVLAQAREPFFTTRSGRRGLGLSLTVGLLRRHGGELSLISTPGQGTTARLRLLGIDSEM